VGITFIIGSVLILSAPSIGSNAGDRAIRTNGGVMDTIQFERVIVETTASYRTAGLVISLVSGFGLVTGGYVLFYQGWCPNEQRDIY